MAKKAGLVQRLINRIDDRIEALKAARQDILDCEAGPIPLTVAARAARKAAPGARPGAPAIGVTHLTGAPTRAEGEADTKAGA